MEETGNEVVYERKETSPLEEYLKKIFAPDGWGTKLLTPVGSVRFADGETARAFKTYLDRVAVGTTFSIAELLLEARYGQERGKELRSICAGGGGGIFLLEGTVTDARLRSLLGAYSVRGLCSLLTVCGGAELTPPVQPGAVDFVHSCFVILRNKDADAIQRAAAQLGNARLLRVGSTAAPGVLRIAEHGVTANHSLSEWIPSEPASLSLGDDCTEYYTQGRDAALASYCFSGMPWERVIRFAESLPLPQFLAASLGLYGVWAGYRNSASVLRFAPGTQVGLVVPRPQAVDGDVLYALCPKCTEGNVPLPDQVNRLRQFLSEQFASGMIKSVLPLKKNALSMIGRICGEELDYLPETGIPFGRFAVLAVAAGDKALPGTRLGRFQSR